MNVSPEEAAFGHRTQEQDIRNRINTLFAPPANEDAAAAVPEGQGEEDYETVNEGLTTDTTEGPSIARRGGAAGEEETAEVKATAEANKEEQGI